MPSAASLTTTLLSSFRMITQHAAFRVFMSILFATIGVFLSDSSLFDASSALFWAALTILVILIIYANSTSVMVPSSPFPSLPDLLRFIPQHVAFGIFMSSLFDFIGVLCFPDSSPSEEIPVRLWAVILCLFICNADTIVEIMPRVQFTSIADHLRSIPRHEGFGMLIKELTCMLQKRFPNSSPLEENSGRTWTFIASRFIYSYTGDVISGSLACAILISFLISRHETPIYVFLIWVIYVLFHI